MNEYDIFCARIESELVAKFSKEFLDILAQSVRTCGWSVDHIESARFVDWCYDLAEIDRVDLSPFSDEFVEE